MWGVTGLLVGMESLEKHVEFLCKLCYTTLPMNKEGKCIAVKPSHKLDTLQELARKYAGEPHKLYFIGLLAEHAEEEEMTAEFMAWGKDILAAS